MAAVPESAESTRTVWFDGGVAWRDADKKLHRIDGPAREGTYSTKTWHLHGKLHRLNGPACVYEDGHKEFHVNGKRVSGFEYPAAVAAYCESHPDCPSVAYYLSVSGRFKKPARSA